MIYFVIFYIYTFWQNRNNDDIKKNNVKYSNELIQKVITITAHSRPQSNHQQAMSVSQASRKRFICPYKEQSSYSTVDFVKRAITFCGYAPKTIQTDNGAQFTNFKKTNRVHIFECFCNKYNIIHKLIRPRTPQHNGKVERSHRSDQERFYNFLMFYSYDDLLIQMKHYLRRATTFLYCR